MQSRQIENGAKKRWEKIIIIIINVHWVTYGKIEMVNIMCI